MNLPAHICPVPALRMSGATLPGHHMPSWYAKRQLYCLFHCLSSGILTLYTFLMFFTCAAVPPTTPAKPHAMNSTYCHWMASSFHSWIIMFIRLLLPVPCAVTINNPRLPLCLPHRPSTAKIHLTTLITRTHSLLFVLWSLALTHCSHSH